MPLLIFTDMLFVLTFSNLNQLFSDGDGQGSFSLLLDLVTVFLDYLWGKLEGNLKISSEGCLLSWWTSRTSSWRPPTDTRASLGLLYSWWRLEDARWALKIDKTLLKSAIFIVFSSFGGVLNMKFDEEQLLFWCESCGRAFCGSKTRFKLWRRLKIPTKFWFRMWG